MKRPQPDIGDLLKQSFIQNLGLTRKIKRLWGTTTVSVTTVTDQLGQVLSTSGEDIDTSDFAPERLPLITTTQSVEVFHSRKYYYPKNNITTNEALFRHLGIYNDLNNQNPEGITSAWIYLNKNKASSIPAPEEEIITDEYGNVLNDQQVLEGTYYDFIAANLDKMWWDPNDGPIPEELTLTTSIVIDGLVDPSRSKATNTTNLLNVSMSFEEMADIIVDNYETLWNTCVISQEGVGVINKGSIVNDVTKVELPDEDDLSPDDPWLATLARYALTSNGVPCTVKNVTLGSAKSAYGDYYNTYVVTLEIPYVSFSTSSPIVHRIATDLVSAEVTPKRTSKLSYPNSYHTKQSIKGMDSFDLNNDPDLVTRTYRLWEDEAEDDDPRISSLWVNSGGTYYLIADVIDNPETYGLKRKEVYKYILETIDSGYQKKKIPWWKKALAIIVFVVAFVFAPATGGASTAAAKAAYALLFASLVLTILTITFAALGQEEWASAFAAVNKMIEPLVIVASIYLMFTSVMGKIEAAKQAAATNLQKAAVDVTIQEIASELLSSTAGNFVDDIIAGATDLFTGKINTGSLSFLEKTISLVNMSEQNKLRKISERNQELQRDYEELLEEVSRETNLLIGFSRIYARPATADWSIYAEEFDMPYERGGGNLHIGNIQRTTKQALRKGSYLGDPVFDNILVV
jgi:hypothetical protein